MLPKMSSEIEKNITPRLRKLIGEQDATQHAAFECGEKVIFEATAPRRLGVSAFVMRLREDGEASRDIPFDYFLGDAESDTYRLELDTETICSNGTNGLFYYDILLVRAGDTLFSDSINNLDFKLSRSAGYPFHLLVYKKGFHTPDWFKGAVMYQIFVDRFAKGSTPVSCREDAVINPDWYNGIPQYAEKSGDKLSNNMFFGGTLWGVAEKLEYLRSLGVSIIYLCPIFEAYSNHKYDIGDYNKIDGMFGGEKAFDDLIEKAEGLGIHVILDGVFNHTGDDSRYFNRYKRYGEGGAYQSRESEYYSWYNFKSFPEDYESWWGIEIMPRLNHKNPDCRHFFTGDDGIARKYIRRGTSGWRLDVADELCDEFLDEFRASVKDEGGDREPIIIGEVWENAVEKIAYGARRRYFAGDQLDSVMNYPLKNAIIDFVLTGDSEFIYNTLTEIYSSYPKCVSDCLMNILGTHDTERILTSLGDPALSPDASNAELSERKLDRDSYERAVKLLKIASAIQYTVYGVPSVYYGDEIGSEGYHDPFCRRPFAWGGENKELLSHYRQLGKIRASEDVFVQGDFRVITHSDSYLEYERVADGERIVVALNAGEFEQTMTVSQGYDLYAERECGDCSSISVPAGSFRIIKV